MTANRVWQSWRGMVGLELKKGLGQMPPDGQSRDKSRGWIRSRIWACAYGRSGRTSMEGRTQVDLLSQAGGGRGWRMGLCRGDACAWTQQMFHAHHIRERRGLERLCLCPLCQELEEHVFSWPERRERCPQPSLAQGRELLRDLQGTERGRTCCRRPSQECLGL